MPATSAPLAVMPSDGSSLEFGGKSSASSQSHDHVAPASCDTRTPKVVRRTTRVGSPGGGAKRSWFEAGKRPFAAAGDAYVAAIAATAATIDAFRTQRA